MGRNAESISKPDTAESPERSIALSVHLPTGTTSNTGLQRHRRNRRVPTWKKARIPKATSGRITEPLNNYSVKNLPGELPNPLSSPFDSDPCLKKISQKLILMDNN